MAKKNNTPLIIFVVIVAAILFLSPMSTSSGEQPSNPSDPLDVAIFDQGVLETQSVTSTRVKNPTGDSLVNGNSYDLKANLKQEQYDSSDYEVEYWLWYGCSGISSTADTTACDGAVKAGRLSRNIAHDIGDVWGLTFKDYELNLPTNACGEEVVIYAQHYSTNAATGKTNFLRQTFGTTSYDLICDSSVTSTSETSTSSSEGIKLDGVPTLDNYEVVSGQPILITIPVEVLTPGKYMVEGSVQFDAGLGQAVFAGGTSNCKGDAVNFGNKVFDFTQAGKHTVTFELRAFDSVTGDAFGRFRAHSAIVSSCGGEVLDSASNSKLLVVKTLDQGATCGNNIWEPLNGEQCETVSGKLVTDTFCSEQGDFNTGQVSCDSNCMINLNQCGLSITEEEREGLLDKVTNKLSDIVDSTKEAIGELTGPREVKSITVEELQSLPVTNLLDSLCNEGLFGREVICSPKEGFTVSCITESRIEEKFEIKISDNSGLISDGLNALTGIGSTNEPSYCVAETPEDSKKSFDFGFLSGFIEDNLLFFGVVISGLILIIILRK